jgi:hypothetical protein
MPETLPSSPAITTQPMPWRSSSFAKSSKVVSGLAVTTPLPFIFRIAATFMVVSSSFGSFRPVRLRHSVPDDQTAQEREEWDGS